MGLVGTATKIGIGYVLGTRAGRQRYEQLAAAGKKLVQHPQVQRLAEHPQVQQLNAQLPQALRSKLGTGSSAPDAGAPPRAMVGSPTSPPVVLPDTGGTSAVGTPLPTDPPSPSVPRFDA
jgi:hypothetical protein